MNPPMEAVISISEVVEKHETPEGELETCATLEARYDRAQQQLVVELGSHVQRAKDARRTSPPWLPAGETIREHVPREEATEVARDIFHRWAARVRQAVPIRPSEPG